MAGPDGGVVTAAARAFRRLRVTRDLPELLDDLEFQARPPLDAGETVWAYDRPTRGVLPEGCRAIQLEPGEGPWYPVPANAVEEA